MPRSGIDDRVTQDGLREGLGEGAAGEWPECRMAQRCARWMPYRRVVPGLESWYGPWANDSTASNGYYYCSAL